LKSATERKIPNCQRIVRDWHTEWYKTEATALYHGKAAMDCPLCGQAVGFEKWLIGPTPSGVPVVRRSVPVQRLGPG
jgi:hypothetical protein